MTGAELAAVFLFEDGLMVGDVVSVYFQPSGLRHVGRLLRRPPQKFTVEITQPHRDDPEVRLGFVVCIPQIQDDDWSPFKRVEPILGYFHPEIAKFQHRPFTREEARAAQPVVQGIENMT